MTFNGTSKRTIVAGAFSAALGLALLTGCGASKGGYTLTDGMVDYDGKTLTVTLDCDGSYDWEETATGDGLTFDGMKHDDEQNADVFTFTGTGEGEQELTFTFPSTDDEEEKKVTVETKTDSSGQITATSATGSDGSSGSSKS